MHRPPAAGTLILTTPAGLISSDASGSIALCPAANQPVHAPKPHARDKRVPPRLNKA
jgi:hypothetical protein